MSTNFSVVFCASICKSSAKNNVNFYDNDLRPWLTNPAYDPGLWPPVYNPWLTTPGLQPLAYDPGSPLIHDPWLMTQGSWLPTSGSRPPVYDPRLTTPCSRSPAHDHRLLDQLKTFCKKHPQKKRFFCRNKMRYEFLAKYSAKKYVIFCKIYSLKISA